jgi:hypothetical protein
MVFEVGEALRGRPIELARPLDVDGGVADFLT